MDVPIEPASSDDWGEVSHLLRRSGLPIEGLSEHVRTLLVARRAGAIVGCAALEVYAGAALLRSVAVDPGCRGQGLGRRLVAAAEDLATRLAVAELYLLTETAGAFFATLDYRPVERAAVPAVLQASPEFACVCPASASAMWKPLAPAP